MGTMNRREAVSMLAAGGTALLLQGNATAAVQQTAKTSLKMPPVLTARPLPFAPGKLNGISEKLIVSHHDNNYASAVKSLNSVRADLAATTKDTPPYLVSGLRAKELLFGNSMTLHELYFENLGGDGKPNGSAQKAIASAWGSFADWEEAFQATGISLGGGSGWAILNLHAHTGELRITAGGDHTQTLAEGIPLLLMDMYEHAYQMDYGAAAAKYVEAFFKNINWDIVNRRYERALKAQSDLKEA